MNPVELLKELMDYGDDFDMKTGTLQFSIKDGYISFYCKNRPEYGSISFSSSVHPNGICEGEGICIHCGMTLYP